MVATETLERGVVLLVSGSTCCVGRDDALEAAGDEELGAVRDVREEDVTTDKEDDGKIGDVGKVGTDVLEEMTDERIEEDGGGSVVDKDVGGTTIDVGVRALAAVDGSSNLM